MNNNLIDEENADVFVSDNDVFYADEMMSTDEFNTEDLKENEDESTELSEKDFEDDYFSGPKTQLLDEIEESEDEDEDKQLASKKSLKEKFKLTPIILLDELLQPETYRKRRKFAYDGEKYYGYPVKQIQGTRFVFNILPEKKLKAFDINSIKLI